MQTMPTFKSFNNTSKFKAHDLGMSPSTSSGQYFAPRRLTTLKQSALSSPGQQLKTGFQTQFQRKKTLLGQKQKEISQTVEEIEENQYSSRQLGFTPQIVPRLQPSAKPPGPGGRALVAKPGSTRALYKLSKLENKEQDEVEQEQDEDSSPEPLRQSPEDPNQKLKEEFLRLQQELEALKRKKKPKLEVEVDEDLKGSFLSRSASPKRGVAR